MIEHFEFQMGVQPPLTKEDAQRFIDTRLASKINTYEQKQLEDYFMSKIGCKLLFFMVHNRAGTHSEILTIFDNEVEEYFDDKFAYMGQCYPRGVIPRFKSQYSSLKKDAKNWLNTFGEKWRG